MAEKQSQVQGALKNAASKTITYHFDHLWLLFLDSWEEDFRIKSVVSRNFASLPGSVPMALAILAAGPSNLVVLGAAFLLCEDEEELEEWWDLEEGVEPGLELYS